MVVRATVATACPCRTFRHAIAAVSLAPLIVIGVVTPVYSPGQNAFTAASSVSPADVDEELFHEFAAESADIKRSHPGHATRVQELEDAFMPMFVALPKDTHGNLGHLAVRYALHRLLGQQHGWFVKGLEPDRDVMVALQADSPKHPGVSQEWVASYLQNIVERRVGAPGQDIVHNASLTLRQVAVLGATIEDLVDKEADRRLRAIYETYGFSAEETFNESVSNDMIDTFAMVYQKKGNWSVSSPADASDKLRRWRRYSTWGFDELGTWLRSLQRNLTDARELGFADLSLITKSIGKRYAAYNDKQCRIMTQTLLDMEDVRPGRVLLSSFYHKALSARRWAFTEKIDYLRTLGALDESDPGKPRVIVTNYVGSRPQCLEASGFYAICCLGECESLLSKLERQVASPTADQERIALLVANLSSATITAPRKLSENLLERLSRVAAAHNGRVPLHGRLFAQWMHHAFPRECPYPHEAGTTSPQTPDEWMLSTGQHSHLASEEEMGCHVHGLCAGGAQAVEDSSKPSLHTLPPEEIPWTDGEDEFAEL